jgi:outer membrane protein TolC
MKTTITLLCLFAASAGFKALGQPAPNPVLDQYISVALDSNLVIKQKKTSLEKSLLALQEAKGYFLPSISLGGQYTLAKGGRYIDIPVGDLLNPVYSTLNQLTGTNAFPKINNVSEQFLPNNFYDVRVRTTYPILNPEIKYNREIKEQQIELSETEIAIYKRELIKDIKTAYYTYLLAKEGINIYEQTLTVVERGLKVNESLYKNGKGLPAYINRSEADVQQVQAQLQNAKNEADKAKAYFNFLLNRPLDTEITLSIPAFGENILSGFDAQTSTGQREELAQLQTVESINRTMVKLNESFRRPRVNTFFDLGSQGFDFVLDDRGPYYMFGLQLDMPIFQGKRNLYKIDQSRKDLENTQLQQQLVNRQIELATFQAKNNVANALSNFKASEKQVQAASSYFKLIDRGRTEGTNTFIEWLDARNQLTTAEVQQQITKYKTLIAWADYERQTASIDIK